MADKEVVEKFKLYIAIAHWPSPGQHPDAYHRSFIDAVIVPRKSILYKTSGAYTNIGLLMPLGS